MTRRSSDSRPAPDPALEAIVARARTGDVAAIGAITVRYRPDIVRFLEATIAREAADVMTGQAEDLAQVLFATLDRKLKGYEESGLFRWWLEGVAYNVFRTELRSRLRRRRRIGEVTLETGRDVEQSATSSIYSTKKEALRALASELPEGDRAAWELHAGGLTAAEIAQQLGIKPNAVYQRIDRARRKLTDRLRTVYATPRPQQRVEPGR
jgi:RNA polymerase sigma factor (sigma-70 family)